ncbi:MAG: hypothetical protein ACLPRE_14240, partial [Limisphaerales bacterium]
ISHASSNETYEIPGVKDGNIHSFARSQKDGGDSQPGKIRSGSASCATETAAEPVVLGFLSSYPIRYQSRLACFMLQCSPIHIFSFAAGFFQAGCHHHLFVSGRRNGYSHPSHQESRRFHWNWHGLSCQKNNILGKPERWGVS